MNWFEVDKEGLAKLVSRRRKIFVLHELLQNAWDLSNASKVTVDFTPVPHRPLVNITVEDDDPDGFSNLAHAYTLFAESEKKSDPSKRGRFNLGEKLVLALCESAQIVSTKGAVEFSEQGRRKLKKRRLAGSVFEGLIRMTREEYEEALTGIGLLFPPAHCETIINGRKVQGRDIVVEANGLLSTDVVSDNGNLYRKYRNTNIHVYPVQNGEKPHLFELGIPVMALPRDDYHYDVRQKVPQSMERDSVAAVYLQDVRALVLNALAEEGCVSKEMAAKTWVTDALGSSDIGDETVRVVINERFGKAVIADPSDPEAENKAKALGYTVVAGGTFSGDVWDNIKSADALLPAGKVAPSPKPFSPEGDPLKLLDEEAWSSDMRKFVKFAEFLATNTPEIRYVRVQIANDRNWSFLGCYSRESHRLTVNAGKTGKDWFQATNREDQIDFLIHEFGHQSCSNHLDAEYYKALTRLGAHYTTLALRNPTGFLGDGRLQ